MKFISWNVNGLRAVLKKNFLEVFTDLDADFFCLQETKLQAGQVDLDLPDYYQYWNYAQKKGYSGTAIFTKKKPLAVTKGLGLAEFDQEGRVLTLEYEDFYLVNCYTPNSQDKLKRLDFRLQWEAAFSDHLTNLATKKPVILCGDLNVAHNEIDLKNPKPNQKNAGFSIQERQAMTALLARGFTDTFRHIYPDKTGAYSWWSYRFNARARNAGWRIDYFICSNALLPQVKDSQILPEILGSDHCPVMLETNELN
ncbi:MULTISPECIES: exodeoxyribonuclease III [Ligilactobacillus]|uniref:Exodeoxyribonuclease III n=3 Tax=Ligilactobacillus animalis TaxID=1605 RepID=A0AAJ6FYZ4_9LACO|nr:exodeoxyribonuclease III [Ligilactobacillus animalis]KDA45207.1 exodeoxyribonuclease III (xth) [Ligilactobacillus animalis]MBU5279923.1 exodeoxyribonuclease III [Ligilactobacillus animalis]MDO5883733.1 exodeoxyribonuclease III [Ligilactobacillus animalis]MDU1488085.1 exodeoxyribonuclease III [Ligilactobacillus animalis]MDU8987308.1 exodeoxyribonuclease III [Ligilactobacillus animalis]